MHLSANATDIPVEVASRLAGLVGRLEMGAVLELSPSTYDLRSAVFGLSVAIGALSQDA
jgi:hypothetical protein